MKRPTRRVPKRRIDGIMQRYWIASRTVKNPVTDSKIREALLKQFGKTIEQDWSKEEEFLKDQLPTEDLQKEHDKFIEKQLEGYDQGKAGEDIRERLREPSQPPRPEKKPEEPESKEDIIKQQELDKRGIEAEERGIQRDSARRQEDIENKRLRERHLTIQEQKAYDKRKSEGRLITPDELLSAMNAKPEPKPKPEEEKKEEEKKKKIWKEVPGTKATSEEF